MHSESEFDIVGGMFEHFRCIDRFHDRSNVRIGHLNGKTDDLNRHVRGERVRKGGEETNLVVAVISFHFVFDGRGSGRSSSDESCLFPEDEEEERFYCSDE